MTAEALARFDRQLANSGARPLDALQQLAEDAVGTVIFSVTAIDIAAGVARRAQSSHPAEYPVSGTKPIVRNGFFTAVEAGQVYSAATPEAMLADFPDLDTIHALGCGSVMNLPVILDGRLVATVNLLAPAGHFTPDRVASAAALLAVPAKAAVLMAGLAPAAPDVG